MCATFAFAPSVKLKSRSAPKNTWNLHQNLTPCSTTYYENLSTSHGRVALCYFPQVTKVLLDSFCTHKSTQKYPMLLWTLGNKQQQEICQEQVTETKDI